MKIQIFYFDSKWITLTTPSYDNDNRALWFDLTNGQLWWRNVISLMTFECKSRTKSSGSGMRRSNNVNPFPLTHEHTAKWGQTGSVARGVLSLPEKAQSLYVIICCPVSVSKTDIRRAVVAARIWNKNIN